MSLASTPENTPNPASETPTVDAPELPPVTLSEILPNAVSAAPAKAVPPPRPTTQPLIAEVVAVMREKLREAGKQLRPAISAEILATVIEVEAKRRASAIMQDAAKYVRNRAKSEKITPRFLADAVLDHLGIRRESGRADKSPKKSPPSGDQKGGRA